MPENERAISRRKFIVGGVATGMLFIVGGGWKLSESFTQQDQLEILPLTQDPISAKITSHNIINLNSERIQPLLSYLATRDNHQETTSVLPFPCNPLEAEGSQIQFTRENHSIPSYVKLSDSSLATNYITFSGLRKGSIFRSPIEGEFTWSDGGKREPKRGIGISLQSVSPQGDSKMLLLTLEEDVEILVDHLPIPPDYRGPTFSKETVALISLGQPLFQLTSERNLAGSDYQVAMLGLLFKPFTNQPQTPIGPVGQYFLLDMHFLWNRNNKIIGII